MFKENQKKLFVGVWDYTVILTYLSAVSAIVGISFASTKRLVTAVFCLVFSAVCDTFDGMVARSKKNRTDKEKLYGMQIDSMCDLVAFGVFPSIILYILGEGKPGFVLIAIYFILCSIIRLSWFNVLELSEGGTNEAGEKVFHGAPMPTSALVLPWIMCLYKVLSGEIFSIVLCVVYILIGTAFITDVQIKKPGIVLQIIGIVFALCGVVLMMVL